MLRERVLKAFNVAVRATRQGTGLGWLVTSTRYLLEVR
jgi:hypothetical protein